MKNSTKSLFSLFLLMSLTPLILKGMEDTSIGTQKVYYGPEKAFGQKKSIQEKMIAVIKKLDQNSTLAIDAFSLTNDTFVKEIIKAHQRGAQVTINADGTREENKKIAPQLMKEGISVFLFNPNQSRKNHNHPQVLHNKRFIAQRFNYGVPITYVMEGSANFTHLAEFNEEIMILNKNNYDYYQQHVAQHEKITKLCKKALLNEDRLQAFPITSPIKNITDTTRNTVDITPLKNETAHSFDINILESMLRRIDNAQPGDCLDITTMTFDGYAIINALKLAAQRNVAIRLFVDNSALKFNTKQLEELSHCRIKILVFNPGQINKAYNKYPVVQHRKLLIRKGKKPCVVITSANLTQQSNNDSNDCSFFPDDALLVEQLMQENNKLEKKCVPFTAIHNNTIPKRARDLFSQTQLVVKQPPVKKGKFEATPLMLLDNLAKDIALLKKDIITSYVCSETGDTSLLIKRFKHLQKLYLPLQSHDTAAQIEKEIEQIQALLA